MSCQTMQYQSMHCPHKEPKTFPKFESFFPFFFQLYKNFTNPNIKKNMALKLFQCIDWRSISFYFSTFCRQQTILRDTINYGFVSFKNSPFNSKKEKNKVTRTYLTKHLLIKIIIIFKRPLAIKRNIYEN